MADPTEHGKAEEEQDKAADEANVEIPIDTELIAGPTVEQRLSALESKSHSHDKHEDSKNLVSAVKPNEKWLIVIDAALLISTIVIAGIYYCQLGEMRKSTNAATSAANTAANSLLVSERPWISVQISVEGPLTFNQDGARVLLRVVPTNAGHSPAVRVSHEIKVIPSFLHTPDPRKIRDEVCSQEAHSSQSPISHSTLETWFPGDQPPEVSNELVPWSEIKRAGIDTPLSLFPTMHPNGDFEIKIVYCVAYRPAFSDVQYHTGYILDLERKTSTPPFENTLFNPKYGTVPLSDLLLRYDYVTGSGPDAN
jgi:hypothetical protein